MQIISISLIVGGALFNCWAICVLIVEKRKADRQREAVDKALEEINHHLRRARMMSRN